MRSFSCHPAEFPVFSRGMCCPSSPSPSWGKAIKEGFYWKPPILSGAMMDYCHLAAPGLMILGSGGRIPEGKVSSRGQSTRLVAFWWQTHFTVLPNLPAWLPEAEPDPPLPACLENNFSCFLAEPQLCNLAHPSQIRGRRKHLAHPSQTRGTRSLFPLEKGKMESW